MHQEDEITVGSTIPFTVLVKQDAMGSVEKVCTMNIYKVFIVASNIFLAMRVKSCLGD